VDTLITENKILGSHCEGIFIVDGGNSWILRNLISHNVQGVVIAGSIPYLFMNKISQNKANGLMLIKQSQPTVIANDVFNNDAVGLFIRDKSFGIIRDNQIQ
jgi:F-box protein 11